MAVICDKQTQPVHVGIICSSPKEFPMKRLTVLMLSAAVQILFVAASLQARTEAYIPSSGDGNVTRVTTDDEVFTSVLFGDDPYGVAITPQGDFIVATRPGADSVTIVRTNSFTSVTAQVDRLVGVEPRGVAIESRGNFAYVTNFGADTVSEINIQSFAVTDTIDVGDGPWGVAAIYDEVEATPIVYVANHFADSVTVITDSGVETIAALGDGPVGLALTPDGAFLYVALLNDDAVAIVRTSDNTLVKTIDTGNTPWGVAVGSDGGYVYVSNSLDDTVTVINAQTQLFHATFNVGARPMGVACPKNGDFAYVVNQTDNSISKIDIGDLSTPVTEIGVDEIDGAFALGAFIGGSPPAAPTDLDAVASSNDKIDLNWTDNASDESGFKIERRLDTEDRFVQIAKVDANVTTYSDTRLRGSTAYRYRIRAYTEAADSGYAVSGGATTDESRFSWCFIGTLLE
jgi:YVTN family beta-propeller protein